MERRTLERKHDGGPRPRRPESATATQLLQRKIAQAELQLRELEDESKRALDQQEKEIESLRRENAAHHERVEQLRLESYRPPVLPATEVNSEDCDAGVAADTKAQPPLSSLLLSRNPVYRAARDKAARLRVECADAESHLATTRHTLIALRQRTREVKLRSHDAALQAAVSMSAAQSMSGNARDRLRALEVHVSTEVERLCGVLAEAKTLRRHVDDLLITQTRFERDRGRREQELLLKKREMAFLMEVCSVLCEERAQCEGEVRELQEQLSEELARYEVAFQELSAVQTENEREQTQQAAALQQLREEVNSMRKERAALEKENDTRQTSMAAPVQSAMQVGNRHRDGRLRGAEPSGDAARRKGDAPRRRVGVGDTRHDATAPVTPTSGQAGSSGEGGGDGGAEGQVAEYARCYDRLAELAGTEELDGLVRFITQSADECYRDFHVVNDLDSRINELEEDVKCLQRQQPCGVAAVAGDTERSTINPFLADIQQPVSGTVAADDTLDKVVHPELDNAVDKIDRLTSMRSQLAARSLGLRTQQRLQRHHDELFAIVMDAARQLWSGMGCNAGQLRQLTGYDDCARASLNACLGLVENRVEECLLCLAKHSKDNDEKSTARLAGTTNRAFAPSDVTSADVALSLLKRRDLPPKQESAAARLVAAQRLPASSDEGLTTTPTSSLKQDKQSQPMSIAEMKALINGQHS